MRKKIVKKKRLCTVIYQMTRCTIRILSLVLTKKKTRKNDWLVAQSDALQSLAFLVNNSLK